MAEIQAFRGLRYDLGHVGSLSGVVAPPYDVIGPGLQDELYKKHPANVVRLILNREEPGDDETSNRYTRAARFLKNWRSEGLLRQESDPALYAYHQAFAFEGRQFTRRGFMAAVRLRRYGEGEIHPHEETHAAPKADRLRLIRACRANLCQIFCLYPDPENKAQAVLEAAIADKTPIEATDHLGVVHRMWPVTDVKTIADATAAMSRKPLFIADGHHRYETACNYRDQLACEKTLPTNHPANYVLMMCVSMSDPGMIVLPTHRLFRGFPPLSSDELIARLGAAFHSSIAASGARQAGEVWKLLQHEGRQGLLGLFAARDQRWVAARITEAGRAQMAEKAADHSRDWRRLGVSILHRLVIDTLLGLKDLPTPEYFHSADELADTMLRGENYPLAALVMPPSLQHIQILGRSGERMPAKSTYFYPKLVSGLVINPLQ